MKLTPVVLTQHATVSITEAKEFNLSGKDIDEVEDISCCIELRKLNLSNNRLSGSQSTDGLRRLTSLTWLNLAHNELDQGEFLRDLTELTVLNLSNNRLLQLPAWLVSCTKLKALIVNNNKLVRVENVGKMTDLNTLVISHNEFEQLPALLRNLKLIKLSATHNALRTIPDYGHLTQLKELRLGNNRIASVPEAIASCQALEILDLGANLISGWSDIVALSKMTKLVNLNLKGNKLCEQPDYRAKLLQFIPTLRILDGERFDTKFLERRQKTKQFKEFAAEQIKQNKPFNWFRTKEEREQVRKEREQAKKELEQTEGSTGEGATAERSRCEAQQLRCYVGS
ncbi:hypothetical protein IWQ60_011483 [Tieghemiomyces parasiticus]|uniref:Uncharacterized protein n=1 Tax=Tieghemiomyces parasiticus TaxID=78921 RepID=A0A9W7ZII7_9FUNG|nr:hypothetical protein IWQ60_011483 [Tieghemiomyces parasiticus]